MCIGSAIEKKDLCTPQPVLAHEGREGKVSVPGRREGVNRYQEHQGLFNSDEMAKFGAPRRTSALGRLSSAHLT